jgi:hypothetical protein
MSGLLGGGSKPKPIDPPEPPEPVATPVVSSETDDFEAKQAKKRSAFGKSIVAGNITPKSSGKKKVLG